GQHAEQRGEIVVFVRQGLLRQVFEPLDLADAELVEHPMVAALEMGGEPGGQQDLANQLAYLLPFDTERKLELLALPDAQMQLARIQVLLEHLQGELGID
ncbi:ATP-dependent protease, partial [Pseudomonas aeruginosa]|nr:ATP-dependent protease [Pseudomonas aeruginosa]